MAGIQTHRRSLHTPASSIAPPAPATPPYVSPYPTNGLIGYYDTNYGRAKAVREVSGKVVAFRQMAAGTSMPDLTGGAYWGTDENGAPALSFTNETLTTNFGFALPMPYTVVGVFQYDPYDQSIVGNGGGMLFLTGSTADLSTAGMLLYTGYGGASGLLKYYSGGSYIEVNILQQVNGHAVYGVAASASNTQVALNDSIAVTDLSGGGTTALGSLSVGEARLKCSAILIYNYALSKPELQNLRNQLKQEFKF